MCNSNNIDHTYKDVTVIIFRAVLFSIAFILSLSGCNRSNIKPPVNSLGKINFSLSASQFVIAYENDELWGIDRSSSVIDNESLEQSIQEAKKQPGYYSNPGGLEGLIGTIIGTQIVRESSIDSKITSISRLGNTELHGNLNFKLLLKDIFNVDQSDIYSNHNDFVSTITENHSKRFTILVQPKFYFSENYTSLRINLVTEVLNKNSEVLFRNLYIFTSKPIVCDKNQCVEYWTNNELFQFIQTAKQSVTDLMRLIRKDLTQDNSNMIPVEHTSIRYQDAIGNHYIRGEILDKTNNRMVVRTLRGYLKSIYVDKYL